MRLPIQTPPLLSAAMQYGLLSARPESAVQVVSVSPLSRETPNSSAPIQRWPLLSRVRQVMKEGAAIGGDFLPARSACGTAAARGEERFSPEPPAKDFWVSFGGRKLGGVWFFGECVFSGTGNTARVTAAGAATGSGYGLTREAED